MATIPRQITVRYAEPDYWEGTSEPCGGCHAGQTQQERQAQQRAVTSLLVFWVHLHLKAQQQRFYHKLLHVLQDRPVHGCWVSNRGPVLLLL